jgi:hypothetical protein
VNRFSRVAAAVFGDGVRLPAATSSSGGDTTELLNIPNIFADNLALLLFLSQEQE